MELGRELHEVDRFHQHRRAHLSGPFLVDGAAAAPRVLVSAEAVPYRPNRGVYVVVAESDEPGVDPPGLDIGAALEVPGVAGVWTFRPRDDFAARWKTGRRTITVCWLDDEPLAVAPGLDARLSGALAFAGPFETVVPWQWDWFDAPGSAAGGG